MGGRVLRIQGGRLLRDDQDWTPREPFLAVIGDPVAHSLSPVMQAAALRERGLPHRYLALEVRAEDLAGLRTLPGNEFLVGANVTAPHKAAVVPLCDRLTDAAGRIGVVNTLGRDADGNWIGHNTDSGGLLMVLSSAWGETPPGQGIEVLGSGGAARAAVDALLRWGAQGVTVRFHTRASAALFEDWLAELPGGDAVRLRPLEDGATAGSCLWINALARDVPASPWLPDVVSAARALLLDLRYGPGLPRENFPLGLDVVDGLPLLVMQGGLSFAWWFGPPVPWQGMRAALAD